jgi:putative ABC transport system permease protein
MAALFGGGARTDPWQGTKYAVSTLDDAAGQFTTVITTMRTVSFVVFLALLAICMAGIVNTFRMVLLERTREIGAMRAMGMRSREVLRLFVLEAVITTCAGAVAGLTAALVAMPLVSLVSLPAGGALSMFLTAGHLAFPVKAANTALYGAIIVATGAVAAWSPARSAAALRPVDALRN